MERIDLTGDHMWTLRKNIESRMDAITDAYKKASMSYHELSELIYEYEDIISLNNHQEMYND